MLRHIQKVLPEIQGAKKERSSGVSLNSIRLVSHQSSLTILSENNPPLSVMLQLFKSIHPVQEGSVELLELLSKGELDASFFGSLEPIKDHRFQVREMAKRDLFYILHHNHPLASKKYYNFQTSSMKILSFQMSTLFI